MNVMRGRADASAARRSSGTRRFRRQPHPHRMCSRRCSWPDRSFRNRCGRSVPPPRRGRCSPCRRPERAPPPEGGPGIQAPAKNKQKTSNSGLISLQIIRQFRNPFRQFLRPFHPVPQSSVNGCRRRGLVEQSGIRNTDSGCTQSNHSS